VSRNAELPRQNLVSRQLQLCRLSRRTSLNSIYLSAAIGLINRLPSVCVERVIYLGLTYACEANLYRLVADGLRYLFTHGADSPEMGQETCCYVYFRG
jgi:hypothetical protein